MLGVHSNEVILDEHKLTKRLTADQVKTTFSEFEKRRVGRLNDDHAELILKTKERTEARASTLLDLGEAALARLFGSSSRFDVSVITAQEDEVAQLRVTERGVQRIAAASGVSQAFRSGDTTVEDFVAKRVSTEYQLMLLSFHNTDLLSGPRLEITLRPSGRVLHVSRAQRFR